MDISGKGTLTQEEFIAHAIQQWAISCDEASAVFQRHDKVPPPPVLFLPFTTLVSSDFVER